MALEEYRRKRKFSQTPEPPPIEASPAGRYRFVVQKHHATRLHYDFRLEMEGVLKSWAIPKGPTLDPGEKRLAMMVEDHPLDYMHFEGIIPAGNYGAGTVMVWDTGTYRALGNGDPLAGLEKGDLKFILEGEKLKGEFALVRMRSRRPGSKGNEWLLLKKKDAHAHPGWDPGDYDWSVLSKRSLAEIAADEASETWESSRKPNPKHGIALKAASREEELKRNKQAAARRTLEMTRKQRAEGRGAGRGAAPDPSRLPAAAKAEMPRSVSPMLATLVQEPEDSEDWLYEIKWDGVRAIAFLDGGEVRLQSRSLRDITPCYPDLGDIARSFRVRRAVLDGEIVTLDEQGRSSFARLQQRMNVVPDQRLLRQYPAVYYVFDLLYLDGYDLRRVPLEERKEALRAILLASPEGRVRFSDHQAGEGRALAEAAAGRGLEGIVGKRRDSHYLGRRSRDWQKLKTTQEVECVIGGYTDPRRSRKYFGSLVLGQYRDGKLVHVGNAGSGFTHKSQKEVWDKLEPLRSEKNPFSGWPRTLEHPHWVRPELRARVKFTQWTSDQKMRAPVVLEVLDREGSATSVEDAPEAEAPQAEPEAPKPVPKNPRRVRDRHEERAAGERKESAAGKRKERAAGERKEGAAGERKERAAGERETLFSSGATTQTVVVNGRTLVIKNLDKVFFPEDGYTKRDVIEYYSRISGTLLPHLKDRPLTLKRYPDGIHKPFFFQKDAGEAMPRWIPTVRIRNEHGASEYIHQVVCNDRATLVYLANLGCIDQNVWQSSAGSLENPDFVLFDIDPGAEASFDRLIEVVLAIKSKLDMLGVTAYPKTSGARGMHLWVPLVPEYSYDDSRNFAHLVYSLLLPEARKLVTMERSLGRRPKDRIYLDYQQNGIGKTVPPPYSLRPQPGAPVSTPLRWEEVKPGLDPRDFNIETVWKRLEKYGDLFEGVLKKRQRLEPALERLEEVLGEKPAPARRGARS